MIRFLDQADPVPRKITLRRLVGCAVQTTTLLGCAAIVAGGVALSTYLDREKERTLAEARVDARNLNAAFEQHIVRSIKNIDQALLVARAEFERDPASFSVEQLSKRDYFPSDLAIQISVIGPDGMMRASNLNPSSPAIDLSDREHFRVHVNSERDELFISKPVLGRVSKIWTIQFTRKMRDAAGRFAGVIVASVDPYFLSRIYESIDLGATGGVTLWGDDGIIRARGGANANVLGKSVGAGILEMAQASEKGVYEGVSVLDGLDRIISFARVPGYPLVVTVSLGREEALRGFERSRDMLQHLLLLVDSALVIIMALGAVETYRLRMTRERLFAKAGMLSSTLANLQEGILIVDAQGLVLAINDRALELMGLPSGSFRLPAPYAQLPLAWRESGGVRQIQEIPLAGERTLEVRTSALPDGGFVKTLSDISARKHDQAVLEEAKDRAEAATRARTSFLATMSHEIRTPLGGIISMVDLIAGTPLDAAQRRYVEITRDSAGHLLKLIDDVLDVTKLDADQVKLENVRFDLRRHIRSTLDILSAKAQEKGLSVGCYIARDVPREIVCDPGRLRQVLINLLGNAIKFTANGHVLLEVTRQREPSGDLLCVRVEDTGIGIRPEHIPDLFRDFSQLDSSISRRFGGTGLGLAISRKLVRRMGGEIGVESEAGRGSSFFFRIPLAAAQEADLRPYDAALAFICANAFHRNVLARQLDGAFAAARPCESVEDAREWLCSQPASRRRILLLTPTFAVASAEDLKTHSIESYLLCTRGDFAAVERAGMEAAGVVYKPLFLDALCETLSRGAPTEGRAPDRMDAPAAGQLEDMAVLVAEDNSTNRFALVRMLERMGARVTAAADGREALQCAQDRAFDVILMDVMMPEIDGLAVARALRDGEGPNAAAPIIALTASAMVEDRAAALATGMDAFATKPITAQQLLETIEACLGDLTMPEQPGGPEDDAPVFDRAMLDQLSEDLGPEHMTSALNTFFEDVRKRAGALRAGALSADLLRKESHALKGSAASFGFRRLAQAAEKLETAARRGEADAFAPLLALLLSEAEAAPVIFASTA